MIRRLLRGVGANTLFQIINICNQLTLVPILASIWGAQRYGVWLLLSTVPSYLSFGDFGLGSAAVNDMTMAVARGDRQGALKIFQSAWVITTLISLIICSISYVVYIYISKSNITISSGNSSDNIQSALLYLCFYGAACLQTSIVQASYTCSGNFAYGISLLSIINLFEGAVTIISVFLKQPLQSVAINLFFCRLICIFIYTIISQHKVPWLKVGIANFSFLETRRLIKPALAVMTLPLAQAAFLQGTTLIIGMAASSASIPSFTTVRTVVRSAIQLSGLFNHAVMPELSAAKAKNDSNLQKKIVSMSILISLIVAIPTFIIMILFGVEIVNIWTGGKIKVQLSTIVYSSIYMIFNCIWHPLSNLILSINKQEKYSYVFLIAAVFSNAFTFFLVRKYGVTGAAMSICILDIFMLVYILRLINTLFFENGTVLSFVEKNIENLVQMRRHFFYPSSRGKR